jgi:hypothetical protein
MAQASVARRDRRVVPSSFRRAFAKENRGFFKGAPDAQPGHTTDPVPAQSTCIFDCHPINAVQGHLRAGRHPHLVAFR